MGRPRSRETVGRDRALTDFLDTFDDHHEQWAGGLHLEVAARLTAAGKPPKVLTAGAIVGSECATELFESAYDEHAHRLAKLYENVGATNQNKR